MSSASSSAAGGVALTQFLVYWPDALSAFVLRPPSDRDSAATPAGSGANATQSKSPATPQTDDAGATSAFVVGWNPRGTVVCVADIIEAATVEDAESEVRRVRSSYPEAASGLRVLGRLHRFDAKNGGLRKMRTDDGSKSRRSSVLWAELAEGPSLVDLYVCGFHVAAQLVIVRYRVAHRYDIEPVRLTAVSRLGHDGVRRALAGERATSLAYGTISRVEGTFLPPHRANLDVLKRTEAAANDTPPVENLSLTADPPPSGLSLTSKPYSAFRATHGGSANSLGDHSPGAPGGADDEVDSNPNDTSLVAPPDDYPEPWSPSMIDPSRPPRLEFPCWANTTELSKVLQCVNRARVVRRLLRDPAFDPHAADGGSPSSSAAAAADHVMDDNAAAVAGGPNGLLLRALTLLLTVVTFLARFSYVMSILEFKLRELVCAIAIVTNRAGSCGLHAFVAHSFIDARLHGSAHAGCGGSKRQRREKQRCLYSYAARTMLDVALGVGVCVLLLRYSFDIAEYLSNLAWWGVYELHIGYLDWFHGWPAGFKLNDELNEVFGLLCRGVFAVWRALVQTAIDVQWVKFALHLWIVVSAFGLSFAVAFVADVCNVVTLHIRNMRHLMAVPYRVVLAVMSSLLNQFRGRRRNPLRNRVDEWVYGADEMVVGMLLGTVTAFAAPTVAMYYLYFAVARSIIWVLQETLRGVAMTACYLPVYPFYLWAFHRSRNPSGIAFENLRVRTADASLAAMSMPASPLAATPSNKFPTSASLQVVEVDLVPRPMAVSEVVAEILVVLKYVTEAALNPSRIMRFVFKAHEKPIIDLRGSVFAHLIKDPAHAGLSTNGHHHAAR